MSDNQTEQTEVDAAAAEAAAIGGPPGTDAPNDAQRPLDEAGEGEAEGYEQAEDLLVEHATHGDQHDAGHVIGDASKADEDRRVTPGGDADAEFSSETVRSDR